MFLETDESKASISKNSLLEWAQETEKVFVKALFFS